MRIKRSYDNYALWHKKECMGITGDNVRQEVKWMSLIQIACRINNYLNKLCVT